MTKKHKNQSHSSSSLSLSALNLHYQKPSYHDSYKPGTSKKGVTITPKKYTDDILVCLFKDKKDRLYVERDRAWKNGKATWVYFKYEHLKTFCYNCGILGHDQSHYMSDSPATLNLYGPWLHFDNQFDIPPPQVSANPTPSLTPTPASLHLDSETPSLLHRSSTSQKPKYMLSFNFSGSDTNRTEESDNTSRINAPSRMYYEQGQKSSTIAYPKKAEGTEEPKDFLHRGDFRGNPTGKKNLRKPARPISLSTDSLYSRLIEMRA
ncbi:hypothetical protein CRG98_033964 [Punica granatum]|uniref:Zinc knuckle CX2CX4HX4C domain-containing protein n=1 Tax=Punica granatum TaxID=22663 RepID=A0A2I0INR4_PUNGR|nr:hypothetical protein CRG98_033964 [Punica granatum]